MNLRLRDPCIQGRQYLRQAWKFNKWALAQLFGPKVSRGAFSMSGVFVAQFLNLGADVQEPASDIRGSVGGFIFRPPHVS
jgi:hypothetical protein